MVEALIVGLVWLTCTAAITLVIGRALRRADARQEQDARDAAPVRAPVVVPPRPVERDPVVSPDPPPADRGPGVPPGPSRSIPRPSGHGLPPASRRPGRRRP